ncbi:hypothetical protein HWV62_31827 [Athelia sp. TMB]|nr:hypothetical protein HWV62_31827 [Athelia sp. TMB]
MKLSVSSILLALAFSSTSVLANTYSLSSTVIGSEFLSAFSFEAIADPTHGFVGAGRKSVRIKSNAAYTTHVAIFNVNHMPEGCGTWPAIWEVNEANWPGAGEIDIVEGVNNVTPNQSTLQLIQNSARAPVVLFPLVESHKQEGNVDPASRTTVGTDCNANDNGNAGCGVKSVDQASYGPAFNNAGGGWYALERTSSYIKVWFWERSATSVPSGVSGGASSINTANWGEPTAFFPNTDCNISSSFGSLNIIINLTFCGDWAGQSSVYASSGCPSTCNAYVAANPSAFTNAYFDFASLRIYE